MIQTMKLKYVLLSGLFMSVGFAACTNDDFTEAVAPVNTEDAISLGEGYTITVAKGNADTRAYMEDLQTAVWEETDQLGAAFYNGITKFNEDGTVDNTANQTFSNTYSVTRKFALDSYVDENKKAAKFKTTEPISAGAYVLYYPYKDGQPVSGPLAVSMLDEDGNLPAQTMDCEDPYACISANMFAYSPVAFLEEGAQSTENFTLNQLTNVFAVKFQVTASDIFKLVENVKIAKVIISATNTADKSVIPTEGTIEVSGTVDYNKGDLGKAAFKYGDKTADMLIADVANATDAYSIQEIKKPTEAYYISTLPFSGDATEITVQMLTEDGEVFAKTYKNTSDADGKKVVDAINKLAKKEGQLIQLTVTLEDLVDTKTIFTADQFKAQWEDALGNKEGAELNVAQPLDLSDMDLTIDNEVADITIKGEAVTVKYHEGCADYRQRADCS